MATKVALDLFLPHVLPYAPGCPKFVALDHLRRTANRFLEQTKLWRETIEQAAATQTVTIDLTDHEPARVCRIYRVAADDIELRPERMNEQDFGDVPSGTPSAYYQAAPGTLTLWPFTACTLTIEVALKLHDGQKFGATAPRHDYYNDVPDFLFEDHAETIAAGALGSLVLLPKQPFTDLAMSGYWSGKYDADTAPLTGQGSTGQHRARRRVRPQFL